MDDKPLVVALADEDGLRHYYENVAHELGISCRAFRHYEEVPADLRDAKLAILNNRALCNVSLFLGSRVLMTGGDVFGDYRDYHVNEVWQNPVSVGVLQGLMRKYTSDKPRVLCVDDDKSYLAVLLFYVRKAGFAPVAVENIEDAFKQVPSVRAVISDLRLINKYDESGCDLLDKVREIYDGFQLPFALISGTNPGESVKSRAVKAQIVQEKPARPEGFLSLIDRLVPQHLKPQKQA